MLGFVDFLFIPACVVLMHSVFPYLLDSYRYTFRHPITIIMFGFLTSVRVVLVCEYFLLAFHRIHPA